MERNVWEKDAKGWKISQLNCDNFCRNPGGSQRAPFCWAKEESMVGKGDNQRKISFEFHKMRQASGWSQT